MATKELTTIEELERMSSDERLELVRGELHRRAFPSVEQARLQVEIGGRLYEFATAHRLGRALGRAGIVLTRDPDTVLAPALAFLRSDENRRHSVHTGFLQRTPELVVEIVARHMRMREIGERVLLYKGAGMPLVWVVDPGQQRVEVWNDDQPVQVISAGGVLEGGDVLPGFQLPLSDIFG